MLLIYIGIGGLILVCESGSLLRILIQCCSSCEFNVTGRDSGDRGHACRHCTYNLFAGFTLLAGRLGTSHMLMLAPIASDGDSVAVCSGHAPCGCGLLGVHCLPRVRLLWRELGVPCPNDRQLLSLAHSNALLLTLGYSVVRCLVETIANPAFDALVHDPLRLMTAERISVRGHSLRRRRLGCIILQLRLLLKECIAGTC